MKGNTETLSRRINLNMRPIGTHLEPLESATKNPKLIAVNDLEIGRW